MKPVYGFLDACKAAVRAVLQPVVRGLNKVTGGKLSPDVLTITSLIMHVPLAWLIAQGYFGYAAVGLVFFGLFDALDGALARLQGSASKHGMLLDSVTDKMKEVMLYTGVAISFVNYGRADVAYWAVIACGASLCVSYVNAWGEVVTAGQTKAAVNQAFRSGLARYEVRMFILVCGLLGNQLILATIIIGILAIITVFERLIQVIKSLE